MFFWILITIQIFCLIAGFFTVCRLFYIFWSFNRNGVPYVPTPRSIVKKMVVHTHNHNHNHAKKSLKKVVDLGSGTGKMLFHLARLMPLPTVFCGVERSLLLYCISRARALFSPHRKRIFLFRDSWNNHSLKTYDAVFVFLTTGGLASLLPKFSRELEKGAVIVSYMFPLPLNDAFDEYRYNYKKSLGVFLCM